MKRYNPLRADARPIEEKALGLIMAMDDAAAWRLREALERLASQKLTRAQMFCGKTLRELEGE